MPNVPILLENGWLAGPTASMPTSCSQGASPDYLDTQANTLFTCVNGAYVPAGGTGTQTPLTGPINANNNEIDNLSAIGIGGPSEGPGIGVFVVNHATGGVTDGLFVQDKNPNTYAGAFFENDVLATFGIRVYGSAAGTTPNLCRLEAAGVDMAFALGTSGTNIAEHMRLTQAGNLGIGLPNPAHQLQLSTDDAAKLTTTTWTIASDARLKQNVRPLEGGLDVINQILPVEAEYNGLGGTVAGQRVVSVVAEDLATVLPGCVPTANAKLYTEDTQDTPLLGFNSHEIIMQLVLAVHQLNQKINDLQTSLQLNNVI